MNARCSSCSAPILWAKTAKGKPIPLDLEPRVDGNVVLERGVALVLGPLERLQRGAETRYVAHFATCPSADEHRRAK